MPPLPQVSHYPSLAKTSDYIYTLLLALERSTISPWVFLSIERKFDECTNTLGIGCIIPC